MSDAMVSEAMLAVDGVSIAYGGLQVLDDVSFEVFPHQIFGIIGPNGAGKTTLFNCISGVARPDHGRIRLEGAPIVDVPVHQRSLMGIARTFQNLNLFGGLTVLENLMVPIDVRERRGLLADAFRAPRSRFGEGRAVERARGVLHLLDLLDVADTFAADLPVGLERRVETGRALAQRPSLLLLDEPASGLDARETAELARVLPVIRTRLGVTIVLVDHDMGLVMKVCEHLCALDFGVVIADGSPAEVRANPAVISAYLGDAARRSEEAHA